MWKNKKALVGLLLFIGAGAFVLARMVPWKSKEDVIRHIMVRDQIHSFSVALGSYKLHNGMYPTTEQGLEALIEAPKIPPIPKNYFSKGYITDRISLPKDPWGHRFIYKSPDGDKSYSIRSMGRWAWYSGDDIVYFEK